MTSWLPNEEMHLNMKNSGLVVVAGVETARIQSMCDQNDQKDSIEGRAEIWTSVANVDKNSGYGYSLTYKCRLACRKNNCDNIQAWWRFLYVFVFQGSRWNGFVGSTTPLLNCKARDQRRVWSPKFSRQHLYASSLTSIFSIPLPSPHSSLTFLSHTYQIH